jgi:ABC-type transport system substrate-binding protein
MLATKWSSNGDGTVWTFHLRRGVRFRDGQAMTADDVVWVCPYKGRASYYSAQVGSELVPDIAWTYTFPVPEAPRLEQLIVFFDERVDTWVDGEPRPRPVSNWS